MIPCGKNGRICLGCGKIVTDFRNYKMKEIVKTHLSSPAPVCGIYTDKQLNNWGQIKGATHFIKLLSISSIFRHFLYVIILSLRSDGLVYL